MSFLAYALRMPTPSRIRTPFLAAGDGNPGRRYGRQSPDQSQAKLAALVFTTPFPSYPAEHGGFGAAARRALEHVFGPDGHAITLTNPLVPDVVLHYTSWKQITDDVDDARIFGGVHYRFDMEAADRQGRRLGAYILRPKLCPVPGGDDCSLNNEPERGREDWLRARHNIDFGRTR